MTPPLRIAPSILACDFSRLGEELARAEEAGADWHHVDVMDGHFVPNLSIGLPVVAAARKASRIPLDVHLMIEEPGEWAERFASRPVGVDCFCLGQCTVAIHRQVGIDRRVNRFNPFEKSLGAGRGGDVTSGKCGNQFSGGAVGQRHQLLW